MADDNSIEPADNDDRAALICEQLANTELKIVATDTQLDVSHATRIPFSALPYLGAGLSSLVPAFSTVTATLSTPTLLSVTDKAGRVLDPSILQSFNDGSGLMGSFRDAQKGFGQARFHIANTQTMQTTVQMPFDPTSLFTAAALAQINQRLNAIQEGVEQVYQYMDEKDKAQRRANLDALQNYLNGYKHNWNNKTWIASAHSQVMTICRETEASVIQLRAQIGEKAQPKAPLEIRPMVEARLGEVVDRMKEYQLAVYTCCFASFLEPVLSENYNSEYLKGIADSIEKHGLEYRELYTKCYNAIEKSAEGAADTALLNGVSSALDGLSGFIEKTPVGDATLIDEALSDASRGIAGFNDDASANLMKRLHQAKAPDVSPFGSYVRRIDALYNKPHKLLADKDAIYVLTEDGAA